MNHFWCKGDSRYMPQLPSFSALNCEITSGPPLQDLTLVFCIQDPYWKCVLGMSYRSIYSLEKRFPIMLDVSCHGFFY